MTTMTNYLNWSNTEPVRFLARRPQGTATTHVRIALRQAVRRHEARAAGMTLSGQETAWNLPVALLGSTEPQPGDVVVDAAGGAWVVQAPVQKLGRGSRWKLYCVKER